MAFLMRRMLLVAALAASVPAWGALPSREQRALTDAQAKAGFLYNCTMFVSWPAAAVRGDEIVIGVVGDDAVAAVAADMHGQKVDGRTLRVVPARPGDDLGSYHILFVAGEDSAASRAVLRTVGTAPVLTVGESDDFTSDGGLVRLYTDQGRLRFEVNMTRVELAGLKVSAKMLGLARIVR